MGGQDIVATHHAILVGINDYSDSPLTSCVRDVEGIKNYLEEALDGVQIQILTATGNESPKSCIPAKDHALPPTYENVTAAFRRVTFEAKAGDFVYIHYSGHGTRMVPHAEFSNRSTGDLALVLLDEKEQNTTRYLWGSRLAFSLKAMVDKGLVVTLVLDCCFSATVYRRDNHGVRSLAYDAEIDSKPPSDFEDGLEYAAIHSAERNASMRENYLLNPDRYAILVACGPHEVAKELISEDGKSHGALSYFLLKTFTECDGLRKRHKDIYHHLCAKFQETCPQQKPAHFGNKNQAFFGDVKWEANITPLWIVERDRNLQLQAGQAHNICYGDEFALSRFGLAGSDSSSRGDLMKAKVAHTRGLTSDLRLLGTTSIRVQTGWIAKPLTRLSFQKYPIRLAANLPNRDELVTALKDQGLDVSTAMDERPFSFHVVMSSNQEYEILDESDQEIINLLSMPQDQADASYVCRIVEHLVKFKQVKNLDNEDPSDTFQQSFDVYMMSKDDCFRPKCLIEVEHGRNQLELIVENKGEEVLYLYFYNLGPHWQIENILRGSYEVLPPKDNCRGFTGVFKKRLKTRIPREMEENVHHHCNDFIKVFVTSQQTSFDLLELPRLGESIKKSVQDRVGGGGGSQVAENWVALNFPIRTFI